MHEPTAWTVAEVQLLRKEAHLGARAVALLLGRSVWSVRKAAHRYRVSLRPRGERRGHILGQPRSGAWTTQVGADPALLAAIRADVLAGVVDLAELEARVLESLTDTRPLCPSCGRRPQERRTTGLCEPCHIRALAWAHRDEQDRREARRDLWRARQGKHRAGADE